MSKAAILALFSDAQAAAQGAEALEQAGFTPGDYDILSGAPYPEGSFGDRPVRHGLYVFPFIGAGVGFAVGLLFTVGTQLGFPLVTGGKPILSLPPMFIIIYELTLLGAVLFTVLGVLVESRLPRLSAGLYDERITEGYIGLLVTCAEERRPQAERALVEAGAEDIRRQYLGAAAR